MDMGHLLELRVNRTTKHLKHTGLQHEVQDEVGKVSWIHESIGSLSMEHIFLAEPVFFVHLVIILDTVCTETVTWEKSPNISGNQ